MKNSWPDVFVGQSVSMCVQAFSEIAPERLVRVAPFDAPKRRNDDACHSDWWHMAHGTCHRVKACNNFRTALQVGGDH